MPKAVRNPEPEPEPSLDTLFTDLLEYDHCIALIAVITTRIEELTGEQETFAGSEYAIRMATINCLDTICVLHDVERDEVEEKDDSDEESDDEEDEDE